MSLNASQIADQILIYLRSEKKIKLYDAIEKFIRENDPNQASSSITDQAESYMIKVRNQLEKRLRQWEERKLHPQFRWGEIDSNIIISFFEQGMVNGEEPEESKYRLTEELNDYLFAIDPIMFEKLGHKLISLTGSQSFITRSSKDQGIDFGGIIQVTPPKGLIDFHITERIFQNLSIRLVGQAKRYKHDISVHEIRELAGTGHINIIEKVSQKHPFDPVIQKLRDPALLLSFMFIATSKFSRDAQILAKDIGMILMDGTQISQALLHMKIGCKRNTSGYWELDEKGLNNWLTI